MPIFLHGASLFAGTERADTKKDERKRLVTEITETHLHQRQIRAQIAKLRPGEYA